MKAILQPMSMPDQNDREKQELQTQLENLRQMYADEAIFLDPIIAGGKIRSDADAVVFPQLIGTA
ncbi:MAG: hypothetical protein LBD23_19780, partial [Oscillospiraceae bacterium]|nr:hypothetical protein [Oscillospiraceae bacterium]